MFPLMWIPNFIWVVPSDSKSTSPACVIGQFRKLENVLISWISNHIVLPCDCGLYIPNTGVDSSLMYHQLGVGLWPSNSKFIASLSCQISCSQRPSAVAKTKRIPGNISDVTFCPHSNTGTTCISLLNIRRWLSVWSHIYLYGHKLLHFN
jgi:hypothetical protein